MKEESGCRQELLCSQTASGGGTTEPSEDIYIEYWEAGVFLWRELHKLKRYYAVGDDICEKGKWYRVKAYRYEGRNQIMDVVRSRR